MSSSEPVVTSSTATTSSSTDGAAGGDNTVVIVVLVIIFTILVIAAIALRVWWYRRKHGHYPRLCCNKSRKTPSHLRPFGDKTVAARWHINNNNDPNLSRHSIASHNADYRLPSPVDNKKVTTVTETVTKPKSPARKTPPVSATDKTPSPTKTSKVCSNPSPASGDRVRRSSRDSRRKSKESQKLPNDIGLYQDRTLPATLMMTTESKIQMFANESCNLKRSNSATLRKPLNTKINGVEQSRPYSVNIEVYNDFSGDQTLSKYSEERSARHLSAISSQLSSKPSNTSDYVSDVETGDGRGWRKRKNASRLRVVDRRKRVSDCDSAFHDCSVIENEDIVEMYESEAGEAIEALRHDLKASAAIPQTRFPFDERTESQQNTVRSEVFQSVMKEAESDDSTFENQQSSDTESMADSCVTRRSKSKRLMRQYDSDGGARLSSRRSKSRSNRRRRSKRAASDGWESEPGFAAAGRTSSRVRRRKLRTEKRARTVEEVKVVANVVNETNEVFLPPKSDSPQKKVKSKAKAAKPDIKYKTTSLTSPTGGGTVIEMPIYSQATWAGPGTVSSRKKPPVKRMAIMKPRHRSEGSTMIDHNRPQSARPSSKQKRASRKLSIGGGGRYICEYGTLPADLSMLPPDLIAKIGGRPDRLLEPLDRLNFEKLCRPLPTVGEAEAKLSARRLVAEKLCLPPGHRDREILSHTYELESTGLVMTDL